MTAKGKINASTVTAGDRIIVKVYRNDAGLMTHLDASRTKTGEGVMVARVTGKGKTAGRRGYIIETTAGDFYAEPIQTMWLAPEDAPGVKRAHVEALAEHATRLPEITQAEVNAAGKELGDALVEEEISVETFDRIQSFHGAAMGYLKEERWAMARAWAREVQEQLTKVKTEQARQARPEQTLGGQCEQVELDETAQLVEWARSLNGETLAHVLRTAEADGDQRMQEVARRAIAEKLEQPAQTPATARNTGDAYMTQGPGLQVAQRDAELVSLDAERIRREAVTPSDHANTMVDTLPAVLPMALRITLERTDGEVAEVASPQTFTLQGLGAGRWRGVEVRAAGMDGDLMQKRPLLLLNAGVKSEMRWAREGIVSRSAGVLRPGQAVLIDGQPYRLDGDDWQPRLVPVR